MTSDRLRRFLHLERARPGGPVAEAPRGEPDATEERIAGVERPRTSDPAARTRTGARLERFGPEPEPTLELVETEGRHAFVRCRRCGMDNNVFATTCLGCSLDLDTPEQHQFNEQFWTKRQAEAEREAREEVERRELRARAEAEQARATAETMADQILARERRRTGRLWTDGTPGGWNPLGLRLVGVIPDARWHTPVLSVSVGAVAVLAGYGFHVHSPFLFLAGAVAFLLLVVNDPFRR